MKYRIKTRRTKQNRKPQLRNTNERPFDLHQGMSSLPDLSIPILTHTIKRKHSGFGNASHFSLPVSSFLSGTRLPTPVLACPSAKAPRRPSPSTASADLVAPSQPPSLGAVSRALAPPTSSLSTVM